MKLHWGIVGGVKYQVGLTNAFLLFLALVGISGCGVKVVESDPVVWIGPDNIGSASPIQNNCNIIPYFSTPETIGDITLSSVVDSSFAIWTRGFSRLTFQSMGLESKAIIKVDIVDEANFRSLTIADGDSTLAANTLLAATFLIRGADGKYVINIRNTYPWTKASLIRAISYQAGRILGVAPSRTSGDVMFSKMYATQSKNSNLRLSQNDIQKISLLYPTPCGNARWITRQSKLAPFYNDQNKYTVPVTFSFSDSDTLYLLWPKQASDTLLFYKIAFSRDNPQSDYWSKPTRLRIGTTSFETIRKPAGVFAFAVGNRAFVGSGQWFSDPPLFFEYNRVTGGFEPRSDPLKVSRSVFATAVSGYNNKGYVLSINQDNALLSSVSIFDPTQPSNNWQQTIFPPDPIYTATTAFATQDNRICLYNGFAAYFLNSSNQWTKLSFDTADPNQFKQPHTLVVGANEQSLKTFTVGSSIFLLRDNYGVNQNNLGAGVDAEVLPEDLWEINLTSNFQFVNRPTLPAQGIVLATVGHKGNGYVFTSKGRVYQYIP